MTGNFRNGDCWIIHYDIKAYLHSALRSWKIQFKFQIITNESLNWVIIAQGDSNRHLCQTYKCYSSYVDHYLNRFISSTVGKTHNLRKEKERKLETLWWTKQ